MKKPFYKRWWFIGIVIIFILGAIGSMGEEDVVEEDDENETVDTETTNNEKPVETTDAQPLDENELMNYARNITGGTFVKSVSLTDNYSVIIFYNNFDEFKNDNPDSLLSENVYNEYFETGEKIEKILVIENVRLLRQFPTLTGAKMTLPFNGETYSIDMDRESVNDYLGFKVEDLKTEDYSWNNKFVDPIGYNDEKRKEFMNKFGKVNSNNNDTDTNTNESSNTTNTDNSGNSSTSSNINSNTESSTNSYEYYQNCTELRKVYPNGVGQDHPAYASKHDRDKDGWACEQ